VKDINRSFLVVFRHFVLLAGLAMLFATSPLVAQVNLGEIAGTVTDQSGAVVPGSTVTVKDLATNALRSGTSSSQGTYVVTGLEPGNYEVTVTSPNFRPLVTHVEVTVGGHITVDAKLTVGAANTVVEVVGEGGVQVNTQTQELSQVIDTTQLSALPSLTRNPYDFVNLSGNISAGDNSTNSMNSGQNLTTRGVGVAVNGQRESGTEILLDGVENVAIFSVAVGEQIPVDAVREYSLITNNFGAEYGRASGGVVNLTTKSGTNQLHGSVWEFNRLSAYTANTYNNVVNGLPKGGYTRNQFGFAVGGPVMKDKFFFFGSTEWLRVRSNAIETTETLDPAFLAILPANTQAYYKQYGTGVVASRGVATTYAQLQAADSGVLNLINGTTPIPPSTPIFDSNEFTAPFDAGGDVPQNTYRVVVRFDFNPSDKTQMFVRIGREDLNEPEGSDTYSAYPQYNTGTLNVNQSYLYSLSHAFSATVFDNAKVSFTRYNDGTTFNAAYTYVPNLMFVTPSDPNTGQFISMPGLQNASIPGEGGLPAGGPQNTLQAMDDLSVVKGRHSMKFGGQFTYIQLNYAYGAYAQAVEQLGTNFTDSFNDLINAAGNPNGSTLTGFQTRFNPQGKLPCAVDVYGNLPSPPPAYCAITPPVQPASYGRSYRYQDWALYAQDSFRLTPRFTLNYGTRYEHYGVQHNNIRSLDSNFYLGSGSNLFAQVRSGQIEIADQSPVGGFWAPSWGTVAPRIGFAYDVHGNGMTSVRGGWGISYERNFGNVTYNASFNPPASAVPSANCQAGSVSCNLAVTTSGLGIYGVAGPPIGLPPAELRNPNANIRTAQTQFWSLAVGQQLTRGMVFEVSYSGAHGVHLYDLYNDNNYGMAQLYLGDPLVTGPACPFSNEITGEGECLTRPNAQYAAINVRGSEGSSSYNALNLSLQTQNFHNTGLTVIANYTYSKSLDMLSSTFGDSLQGGSGYIGSLGYTDLTNPGLDWGPSDYDIRNRIAVSPIWETPWLKSGHSLASEVGGGWMISGIFTARNGTPFSVYDYTYDEIGYTVPRFIPATPITSYKVGTPVPVPGSPNQFAALTLPLNDALPLVNPLLGISDYGPYPASMTRRNAFRGPGAWNIDAAVGKNFRITERVGLDFRAEGFDVFNHHNFYTNTTTLYYAGQTTPLSVILEKGGLNTLATGGNHDERRFGQFSASVKF
jgi:hypothetical protein